MTTPGFLDDGIDFEQLIAYYKANNYSIEITDPAEVDLIINLVSYVINASYGYKNGTATIIPNRFQMIFNSALQEHYINEAAQEIGLCCKQSSAVWRLGGSYEKGADFQSNTNKPIEVKMYKDWISMSSFIEKGSKDRKVFHDADYVLCYLINSYEVDNDLRQKHWYWLKKTGNVYVVYDNTELLNITYKCLPTSLPICSCKLEDARFILSNKK